MNTTEFAQELGTTPRNARKFLRADYRTRGIDIPGKGSRYDIKKQSLAGLKKRFAAWTKTQDEAKAAREAAKETAPEVTED